MGTKDSGEQRTRRRPGRVPTSCAECRRLKLRCDQKVPCEKCVSRGCASICPNGSLQTGKGNRLVLANTEELHSRIDGLCLRIRELEDALKSLQATISDEPHPLLQIDELQMKAPTQGQALLLSPPVPTPLSTPLPPPKKAGQANANVEEEPPFDSFGTLKISAEKGNNYLGKTARPEYLISVGSQSNTSSYSPLNSQQSSTTYELERNDSFPRLSKRILDAISPDSESLLDESLGQEIFALSPPLPDALKLSELYLEQGKHLYTSLSREELFDDLLASVHRAGCAGTLPNWHDMALVFSLLALGALFDTDRSPYSADAHELHLLSRLCLKFTPPEHDTTLRYIQAMVHIAHYLDLSDCQSKCSVSRWTHVGTTVRLAHSVGLHLNGSRWKLDEDECLRRSALFWEVFLLDVWTSFDFGRPLSMSKASIDCPLPKDADELTSDEGVKGMGFHVWTWQYSKLLHTVMTTAFGPKMPAYSTILDLDQTIRNFPVPKNLLSICRPDETPTPNASLQVQRWVIISSKETTLLNLHRNYFAQALDEQPNDMLKTRYAPSVVATYRSAYRLIEALNFYWKSAPHLLSRIRGPWSHVLSAAIVMCLLVTRAPSSNLTTSSLVELDLVANLFEKSSPICRAALNNLEFIRELRKKAHNAVDRMTSSSPSTLSRAELDRLNGKTHLFTESAPAPSERPSSEPSSSLDTDEPMPPIASPFSFESMTNVHPTIMQDIKLFDGLDIMNLPQQLETNRNIFDVPNTSLSAFTGDVPDMQIFDSGMFVDDTPSVAQYNMSAFPSLQYPGLGGPVLDATWQSFVEQLGF